MKGAAAVPGQFLPSGAEAKIRSFQSLLGDFKDQHDMYTQAVPKLESDDSRDKPIIDMFMPLVKFAVGPAWNRMNSFNRHIQQELQSQATVSVASDLQVIRDGMDANWRQYSLNPDAAEYDRLKVLGRMPGRTQPQLLRFQAIRPALTRIAAQLVKFELYFPIAPGLKDLARDVEAQICDGEAYMAIVAMHDILTHRFQWDKTQAEKGDPPGVFDELKWQAQQAGKAKQCKQKLIDHGCWSDAERAQRDFKTAFALQDEGFTYPCVERIAPTLAAKLEEIIVAKPVAPPVQSDLHLRVTPSHE